MRMDMTKPAAKPATLPKNPNFSSGPCAKRPGWALEALKDAPLGRSHRAKVGKAKLKLVDRPHPRSLARSRPITASASCPAPTPARSKWRCGRCSARAASTSLAWESFGEGWVTDMRQAAEAQGRATFSKPRYGELPDLAPGQFRRRRGLHLERHHLRRARAEWRLDPGRPQGPDHLRRHLGRLRPERSTGPSSMSSPSPGRRCWAARRRMAC